MSPELFSYVSNFEILPFDPLLSGIAVEFISKPLQQIVVQTEEQSTKNVNGQARKKILFLMQFDLLSVLKLDHIMSEIISSECTNVDQVIGDSLVENNFVTKFCWMLNMSRKYFSSLNRETKLLNR